MNKIKQKLLYIALIAGLLLSGCGEQIEPEGKAVEIVEPKEQTIENEIEKENGEKSKEETVEETESETTENETEEQTEIIEEPVSTAVFVPAEDMEAVEAKRKEEYGEFYVPLPTTRVEAPKHVEAKALYITSSTAGKRFDDEIIKEYAKYLRKQYGSENETYDMALVEKANLLEKNIAICLATEVNAFVIDVKSDDGIVAYDSEIEIVNEVKSDRRVVRHTEELLEYLKANGIYTIARVVAFKDPYFAEREPDHAIQLKSGGVYKDRDGNMWVNSFDSFIWKYVISIAKEASLKGYEEIQFDYIRFPDNASYYNKIVNFPGRDGRDKDEGIEEFLIFANEELAPYGVNIGVDVFGQATRSWDDKPEDIGQTWRKMANQVDAVCPMVYPSHYGEGVYGFAVPDQHPYEVLRYAMKESIERNAAQENPGYIRPWIQGFNATWVSGYRKYDAATIAEQIVACKELGIQEYIIWDPQNTYDPNIFYHEDQLREPYVYHSEEDIMGRTPEDALKRFLKAEKYKSYSRQYLLTIRHDRVEEYDTFRESIEKLNQKLTSYDIHSIEPLSATSFVAEVSGTYTNDVGKFAFEKKRYFIVLEDQVYKIKKPNDIILDATKEPLGLLPNEQGRIMVLMYHNIGEEEKEWVRTPDNFRKDLETLYEKGYRPISLTDYVTGNITTQRGYTPVVITVDDGRKNNFEYDENGEIVENCFVDIYMDFCSEHEDFPLEATFFINGKVPFRQSGTEVEKVNFLIEKGMDIGNHAEDHNDLKHATVEQVQRYIGVQAQYLESLIKDENYKVNTIALPYGSRPSDDVAETYLGAGKYEGVSYENIAVLNVGWNPGYSPYSEKFNPLSIPRVRASEIEVDNVGMYNYLDYYDRNPSERYISDGNPDTITVLNSVKPVISE